MKHSAVEEAPVERTGEKLASSKAAGGEEGQGKKSAYPTLPFSRSFSSYFTLHPILD